MNYITISRLSGIPLYIQLKDSIQNAISTAVLKPGDKLPTEEELCDQFSISRPVIRQAYSELISEGVIRRTKGKGTFVRDKEIQSRFFQSLSPFETDMISNGLTPSVKVLTKEILNDPKHFPLVFKETQHSELLHLRFLYLGNGIPMILVDTYLPHDCFPGLLDLDLSKTPLYPLFESEYNRYIDYAKRTVDAIKVNDEGAALLNITKGAAVHEVKTVAVDHEDRILEYSVALYPGERNAFDIMIYKHP